MKVYIIKFVILGIRGWKAAVLLQGPGRQDNSIVLSKIVSYLVKPSLLIQTALITKT